MLKLTKVSRFLCIPSKRKIASLAFAAALLLISMKSTHFDLVKHNIGALIGMKLRDGIEQNEPLDAFIEMKIRGGLKQDGSLGSAATPNCSFEGNIFSSVNKTITKESIKMYDHLQTGFHKIKLTTTVPVANKSRRDSTPRLSESRKPQETDACVYINGSKPGLTKVMNEANFNGTNCSAKNPKFRDTNNQRTALASFPGSGNTWTRHLLEYISGIHTGSIYNDFSLIGEFKAEKVANGSVIAIKTHNRYNPQDRKHSYDNAILLTRNPAETLLAFYNYIRTNSHTKTLEQSTLNKTDWQKFARRLRGDWKAFHQSWLDIFKGRLMVLSYRRLKEDFFNEMFRLGDFLNVSMTYKTLWCAHEMREGKFHRRSNIDRDAVVTKDMLARIATAQKVVEDKLEGMFGEEARGTY